MGLIFFYLWGGKGFWLEKIGSEILLGQKEFGSKKNSVGHFLDPKKLFWVKINFGKKKCWSKNLVGQKNLGRILFESKKFGSEFFWGQKKFGPKKYLSRKFLLGKYKLC